MLDGSLISECHQGQRAYLPAQQAGYKTAALPPDSSRTKVTCNPGGFHISGSKSRAQVQAEAADFVTKGGMDSFKSNNYSPAESSGASSKTREQVQNEYLNETPEQRKDRMELYRGRMF